MGVGQLSESDAVDALRLPFYSSSHPTGSHGWRNQFDLGNPDSHDRTITSLEILADETRVMELSQMLGSDSGVTRSNALAMLEQAVRWKESRGKVT